MKCYGKILRISWTEHRMNGIDKGGTDWWLENIKNQKADRG